MHQNETTHILVDNQSPFINGSTSSWLRLMPADWRRQACNLHNYKTSLLGTSRKTRTHSWFDIWNRTCRHRSHFIFLESWRPICYKLQFHERLLVLFPKLSGPSKTYSVLKAYPWNSQSMHLDKNSEIWSYVGEKLSNSRIGDLGHCMMRSISPEE